MDLLDEATSELNTLQESQSTISAQLAEMSSREQQNEVILRSVEKQRDDAFTSKSVLENRLQRLQQQHDSEVEKFLLTQKDLESRHVEAVQNIDALELERTRTLEEFESLQNEMTSLKTSHSKTLNELDDGHTMALNELEKSHNNALVELKTQHSRTVDMLKKSLHDALTEKQDSERLFELSRVDLEKALSRADETQRALTKLNVEYEEVRRCIEATGAAGNS